MLRITDRDMTRDSQDVAFTRPVPECGRHMFKLPLTLCSEVVETWNAFPKSTAMVYTAGGYLPGRTTSPWEIASSGRLSSMPWMCFSSDVPLLEVKDISG